MKKIRLLLTSALLSALMCTSAFAGEWKQDTTGWWYQNDDGSYVQNGWQWIDGNNDNIAECYYFDASGYCLMNTTTPDNCTVDANGAYIVNGIVQTKPLTQNTTSINASNDATQENTNVTSTVWLSATGEKYHAISNCGKMNPDKARQVPLSEALEKGYSKCSKCY